MNVFCRIFGHTWVHKVEDPKIRWTNAKNLSELNLTASGEPRFYLECVRCKEERDWNSPEAQAEIRRPAAG